MRAVARRARSRCDAQDAIDDATANVPSGDGDERCVATRRRDGERARWERRSVDETDRQGVRDHHGARLRERVRARGEFRWDDSLAKDEAVGGRGDGERDRGVRESEGRRSGGGVRGRRCERNHARVRRDRV